MTKHVHAELMMQYAQDAAETDKPWERWESKQYGGWEHMVAHPFWDECVVYRRKPKFILINGFEVPEPIRESMELRTTYWVAAHTASKIYSLKWENRWEERLLLKKGICHSTKEAAELHANALLSFTAK